MGGDTSVSKYRFVPQKIYKQYTLYSTHYFLKFKRTVLVDNFVGNIKKKIFCNIVDAMLVHSSYWILMDDDSMIKKYDKNN